jgi:hypothetical protein
MKLHEFKSEPQNIEQEISNDEVWKRCAQSFFKNSNDRIPYFDTCPPEEDSLFLVRCLQSAGGGFVIRFFRVSHSIRLAVFQASSDAYMSYENLGRNSNL